MIERKNSTGISVVSHVLEYLEDLSERSLHALHRRRMFSDPQAIIEQLATGLKANNTDFDQVIAVGPTKTHIARTIADRLETSYAVRTVNEIDAPFTEDAPIGAVTGTGTVWRNEERIQKLEVSDAYMEDGIRVEHRNATTDQTGHELTDEPGDALLLVAERIRDEAVIRACLKEFNGHEIVLAAVEISDQAKAALDPDIDVVFYRTTAESNEQSDADAATSDKNISV